MGTLVATYSERDQRFYKLGAKIPLDKDAVRRVRAGPMRYCLGDNMLYIPQDQDAAMSGQLCWARAQHFLLEDYKLDFGDHHEGKGTLLSGLDTVEAAGIYIGDRYIQRWREEKSGFVPVPEFCCQSLFENLLSNPDIISSINPEDFESLCAEIFVRRGFKVDLFRGSRDGGIDFLALQDERTDPLIFAVQVKQPQDRPGKGRRTVGRPVVQQIYGAAKAWNLTGGILVSGSTYSPEAKAFADVKPSEMSVYNGQDLLSWIAQYRWNEDESG